MEPRTKYLAVGAVVVGLLMLALLLPPYLERRAKRQRVQDFQQKLNYTIDTRVKVQDVIDQPNFPVPSNLMLPTYFKYKQKLLTEPTTQGQCGSCYAKAVTSAFADRLSVRTGGKFRQAMSAQDILSCSKQPYPNWNPCKGGSTRLAWEYIIEKGVPLSADFPYEGNSKEGVTMPCKTIKRRFFAQPGSVVVMGGSVNDKSKAYYDRIRSEMKTEIYLNGPVVGSMGIYDDFHRYDGNSIYKVGKDAKHTGSHAIVVVGWCDAGVGARVKGFEKDGYWICKNSWGTNWPLNLPPTESGYFYIGFGEAGIEGVAMAAKPRLDTDLLKLVNGVKREDVAYISYDKTVVDPERQALFDAISRREQQGRRCLCPDGNYVQKACTPQNPAVCAPCKRFVCPDKTEFRAITEDKALLDKICRDPKNPKYLKEQINPCKGYR